MRLLAIGSTVAVVGGFALALTDTSTIPGIALILLGLAIGAVLGAISMARGVRDSIRDWKDLLTGGPQSVRVVGVEPPQGWLLHREATITLEITGEGGQTKQIQKEMGVPIPQAFMWRMAGRVPTPLGKLTEARELDLALYRKRGSQA